MNRRRLAFIAFMAVCVLVAPTSALAYGGYSGTGQDVSWPQCPATALPPLPTTGSFGIVGVTHGRAFTYNSCLRTEYVWAHASGNASLYVNLNAPVGSTAKGNISTPVSCTKGDKLCPSYNYGWNTAKAAYACASGTSPTVVGCAASVTTSYTNANTTWWLDVETSNSWLNNLAANAQVVQGAIDFLGAGASLTGPPHGLPDMSLTVGVYSTYNMWNTITGGYQPVGYQPDAQHLVAPFKVPVWYATAVTTTATASGYCGSPYAFTGGLVWLVQYIDGSGIDADYAC